MSYQGAPGFQPIQNKFKPFENKWSRFSSTPSKSLPQQQQQHHHKHIQTNHKCTDSDSCRSQIIEDFEHERPLWKLTCYSHCKSGPCDISGDVSYDELRAAAYIDLNARSNWMSIVEREKSLINSKLMEFENIINKYPPASLNLPLIPLKNDPPAVSSFSQFGSTLNNPSATKPINTTFGSYSDWKIGSTGQFGAQFYVQKPPSSVPSESLNFFNSEYKSVSPANLVPENLVSAIKPSSISPSLSGISSSSTYMNEEKRGDSSIWTKEEWKIGEIPEEEPPLEFV